MSIKVLAHRYALLFCSWEVEIDDSLVGQLTSKVQENKNTYCATYTEFQNFGTEEREGEREVQANMQIHLKQL